MFMQRHLFVAAMDIQPLGLSFFSGILLIIICYNVFLAFCLAHMLRKQHEALRSKDELNVALQATNDELRHRIAQLQDMEAAEERRRLLLEQVVQLGKAITEVTEWRACLLNIYYSVKEGLGFDRVGLLLYEPENQMLHSMLGTSRTGELEDMSSFAYTIDSIEAGILHNPAGFQFVDDYDAAYGLPADDPMAGVKEHVSVAVWAGDRPLGMIGVDNLLTQRPMTGAQVEALRLFAGYAGLAMANARLLAQVRDAEQKYRSIFEHAVEGIFQSTLDGRFMSANPAMAHMLGYAQPDELIAQVTDIARQLFVEPDRWAELSRLIQQQSEVHGFEFRSYQRDGSVIWVAANSRAVRDAARDILYFEGSIEDITKRKWAEGALQHYAERM